MPAIDPMPPSYKYDVTVKGGAKITNNDRTPLYLTGTTRIDKDGNVLYSYDIEKQTHRT